MKNHAKMPLLLLITACLLPSFFTYLAVSLKGYEKIIYSLSKVIIVVFPIVFWRHTCKSFFEFKERIGWKKTNGFLGVTTGIAIFCFILASYYMLFSNLDASRLYNRINQLNLVEYFWGVAIFISLWNSFIEEYYWRAFILHEQSVYSRQNMQICVVNGFLFGLHHFIILNVYFDVHLAILFTVGASVGGFLWAWLRVKGVSIIDCYISHVFADLAIMWIGWSMLSKMSSWNSITGSSIGVEDDTRKKFLVPENTLGFAKLNYNRNIFTTVVLVKVSDLRLLHFS